MDETTEREDANPDSESAEDRVFDIGENSISPIGPQGGRADVPSAAKNPTPASSASDDPSIALEEENESMRKQIEESLDSELAAQETRIRTPQVKPTPPTPIPASASAPMSAPEPEPASASASAPIFTQVPVKPTPPPAPAQIRPEPIPPKPISQNPEPPSNLPVEESEVAPDVAPDVAPQDKPKDKPQFTPQAQTTRETPFQTSDILPKAPNLPNELPNIERPPVTPFTPDRPQGESKVRAIPDKPPQYSVYDPDLKPIRTYESDVAEVLAHSRTSSASIAIAESRKREGVERLGTANPEAEPVAPQTIGQDANTAQEQTPAKPVAEKKRSAAKFILLILSILFIAAGIGGAYYLYMNSPVAPVNKVPEQPSQGTLSLVPTDKFVIIPTDGLGPLDIISRIRAEVVQPQDPGTVRELIFSRNSVDDAGLSKKVRVSGVEMLALMDIEAPDVFVRSLSVPWMFGTYTDASGMTDVFVILSTDFFQNSFAGMLQWENVMPDDLKLYLYQNPPVALRGKFEDQIVNNRDVRAFRTEAGNVLYIYSFIDTNKLIISGNTATLTEILKRLEQQAFVR